jgi:hypothetical protein
MLIVLAFHNGDKPQTVRLANWINELGGVKNHECLLLRDPRIDDLGVVEPLTQAFGKVTSLKYHTPMDGWPMAPNAMFDYVCRYIQEFLKVPFLWIEPDSIPLKSNWLDQIEVQYRGCGQPFMGQMVIVPREFPDPRDHMSGVAVYPPDVCIRARGVLNCSSVAWDVAGAKEILHQMHDTKLIQHSWKAESFLDAASLARIRPEAVIFHQNKDGSLIDRLRGIKPDTDVFKPILPPAPEIIVEQEMPTNIVYTFYDPVAKYHDPELMEMWQENWKAHGWRTVVMTLKDAEKADRLRLEIYKKSKNLYAGICLPEYSLRCYARWLPMAAHGGLMVDFDVFNYGFTPQTYFDLWKILPKDKVVHLSGDATPCASFGTSSAYKSYVGAFDDFDANPVRSTPYLKTDVHDQNIIDSRPDKWIGLKMVSLYPDDTLWSKYPMVHYTHGKVQFPRSKKIRIIRNFDPVPRKRKQATPRYKS